MDELSSQTESVTPAAREGADRSASQPRTLSEGDNPGVVCCDSLCKNYGTFAALTDCSLRVNQGDVFGLLGPNGAGKTTLIRSLLGYLQISSGSATVCGADPLTDSVSVRERVAYLPGDARLPRYMRGESVLKFFADVHPAGDLIRSREIAERLELDTRRMVGMMSTGMRQKLALAVVMAPKTPLLILDEPTANLDPSVRATVLDLVREAHRAGRTVILSSHVMSEIEETCNRVAFLRQGRLAKELEMRDLFQRHRVWGRLSGEEAEIAKRGALDVPAALQERVEVKLLKPEGSAQESSENSLGSGELMVRVDTAGELAEMLPWISSLNLRQMRIEPLGLRAVYDSVHQDAAGEGIAGDNRAIGSNDIGSNDSGNQDQPPERQVVQGGELT